MDYIYTNGELYHHGVKGMKWGIRRYQNKDGSLTPLGRKRYGTFDGLANSDYGRKMAKKGKLINPSNSQPIASKKTSEMSDEELRSKIQSLQLQKTYNQLYSDLHPPTVSKGKQFAKFAWDNAGKPLLNAGVKKLSDEILGKTASEVAKKEFEKLKREAEIWEAKGKISKNKRTVDENNSYFNDKSKDQKSKEKTETQEKVADNDQKDQTKAAAKEQKAQTKADVKEQKAQKKAEKKAAKKMYADIKATTDYDYLHELAYGNNQRKIENSIRRYDTKYDSILEIPVTDINSGETFVSQLLLDD